MWVIRGSYGESVLIALELHCQVTYEGWPNIANITCTSVLGRTIGFLRLPNVDNRKIHLFV